MLPKKYLKNILPNDIYELYENVKITWYKYLTSEKVNENRNFYTELYLIYLDNKTLFVDNLKSKLFWWKYDIEDYSSDWCAMSLFMLRLWVSIDISWLIKYYNIYYLKNDYNKEEKEYINIIEEYIKNCWYKKIDEDILMLVTMYILWYQFETKDDLLNILKKEYKKLYSWDNYFLNELNKLEKLNLWDDYRERDFKMFMYDELNQWKYMNVYHLLFCGDSMF